MSWLTSCSIPGKRKETHHIKGVSRVTHHTTLSKTLSNYSIRFWFIKGICFGLFVLSMIIRSHVFAFYFLSYSSHYMLDYRVYIHVIPNLLTSGLWKSNNGFTHWWYLSTIGILIHWYHKFSCESMKFFNFSRSCLDFN